MREGGVSLPSDNVAEHFDDKEGAVIAVDQHRQVFLPPPPVINRKRRHSVSARVSRAARISELHLKVEGLRSRRGVP